MIVHAVVTALVLLGAMCALLAVLRVVLRKRGPGGRRRGGTLLAAPPDQPDLHPRDFQEFQALLDEHAPEMLQHLAQYRQAAGAGGVEQLASSYHESSPKKVRKTVLAVFHRLYAADDPDDALLDSVLDDVQSLRQADEGAAAAQLLSEIHRVSPAQLGALFLLQQLFDMTEVRASKIGDKLKDLTRQEIPSAGVGLESRMARLLSETYELADELSRTLPRPKDKNKASRRAALEASRESIRKWRDGSATLNDPKMAQLPEVVLLRQIVLGRLWGKINDFMAKSGGRAEELPWAETPRPWAAAAAVGRRRRFGPALAGLAVMFFGLAGAVWVAVHSTRFDAERAVVNVVKIETPAGTGTGFFIQRGGWIVSNYHVVRPYREVTVKVKTPRRYDAPAQPLVARVVSSSRANDVAILRVADPYAPAEMPKGFRMARGVVFRLGQTVHVLGNPLGLSDIYTSGKVMKVQDGTALIDVKVGPGNSGGPVCDDEGVVIGITAARAERGKSGFDYGVAVSTEAVWRLIDQIERKSQ